MNKIDISGIQAIVNASTTLMSWCLSLFGGSLLAILSTSYIKPIGKWIKLIYLLFIPAWIFLAYAIKWGYSIERRGIIAALDNQRIPSIEDKMNVEYSLQLDDFSTSLFFLGTWLLLYLLWWVSQDFLAKPDKQ